MATITGDGAAYELFGVGAALSGDGGTALVGNSDGTVFVFVRSGSAWKLQAKLASTATISLNGHGLALSFTGNTALIAGYSREAERGVVWVFTRRRSGWSQSAMLAPRPNEEAEGISGVPSFESAALSSDGNTALIGAPLDHYTVREGRATGGAAWVFARSHSGWTQQGPKLVVKPRGAPDGEENLIGWRVALSGDGTTALLGGADCHACGAVGYVFTRSRQAWTQRAELTVESEGFKDGLSGMALSQDGDSALISGGTYGDKEREGTHATNVFTRSGSAWALEAVLPVEEADGLSRHGDVALIADSLYLRSNSTWTKVGPALSPGYVSLLSVDAKVALTTSPEHDDNQMGEAFVYER